MIIFNFGIYMIGCIILYKNMSKLDLLNINNIVVDINNSLNILHRIFSKSKTIGEDLSYTNTNKNFICIISGIIMIIYYLIQNPNSYLGIVAGVSIGLVLNNLYTIKIFNIYYNELKIFHISYCKIIEDLEYDINFKDEVSNNLKYINNRINDIQKYKYLLISISIILSILSIYSILKIL